MRRILIGVLAAIGALSLLVLIVLAGAAWYLLSGPPGLPDRMVLTLDLRGGIEEIAGEDPLSALGLQWQPTVTEVVLALEAAGEDERVAGLLVRLDGQGPGFAQLQELRDAVTRFRAHGKFAAAHADSFGEFGPGNGGYYLASAFGQIDLQPVGALGLTGLILETPLVRGLLDKLGILPSGDRRGDYKNIYNTLTERSLTPAHRESLASLADSLYRQFKEGLSAGRGLDLATITRLIDGGPYVATEAERLGLVDRLSYWDETVERVREQAGPDSALVPLMDYALSLEPASDGAVVALVYGVGQIRRGESTYGPIGGWVMGADTVARALADAIDDPEVEAILFRIDSGGGSAVASDTIGHQVRRAVAQGKPVIVSMGNAAASGGYWIAMDATRIVAQPGTLTGSIGVVAGKLVLAELWQNVGVNWGRVARGANADMWSTTVNYSARGRARLDAFLDWIYDAFTDGVARGRDLPKEEVLAVAEGRVWTGAQAKERGLVDELGGVARALAVTREAIDVAPDQPIELRRFPAPRPLWEQALELLVRAPAGLLTLESVLERLSPSALSMPPIRIR